MTIRVPPSPDIHISEPCGPAPHPSQVSTTPTKLLTAWVFSTLASGQGPRGFSPPPTPLCSLAWEGVLDLAQWLPPASLGKPHLRPTRPRSQQRGQPSSPHFFSSLSSHGLPRTSGSQHSLPGSPQSQEGCFTPTRMVSSEYQKVMSANEDMEKAEGLGKVGRKVKWCKCDGK